MASRKATNELIELCESGVLDWETLARKCLCYVGESKVESLREWCLLDKKKSKKVKTIKK